MRHSISGTWITGLVIGFTFVFAAFLALSINYSKAFRVKNEVLSIIERNGGLTDTALKVAGNYLINTGYTLKAKCGSEYTHGVTVNGINDTKITPRKKGTMYSFCVNKKKKEKYYGSPNFPNRSYYEVKLFFKFNLPIIGDIFTFDVKGQTKDVSYPLDKKRFGY